MQPRDTVRDSRTVRRARRPFVGYRLAVEHDERNEIGPGETLARLHDELLDDFEIVDECDELNRAAAMQTSATRAKRAAGMQTSATS